MKTILTLIMSSILLLSCNKLTTVNSATPVVFDGIKAIDTTSKGTAIVTWDSPRGAKIAGFAIYIEDLSAANSTKTAALKLASGAIQADAQDVTTILVNLPDEQAPVGSGVPLKAIAGDLNSYEISKLLPGRYAIQVKAVAEDVGPDNNTRVAILKVESTLGYEGISKAEIQGQDVYLEWPQLETTLTSRDVVYTIYEGVTFANPVAITSALNFKLSLLSYAPGTALYFGVRSTDAKGRTDRNIKTIPLTVPTLDSTYEGCVNGEARGSDRITVNFAWPNESFQTMNILRDGVQVYSTTDKGITSYTDVGLQEGESYKYTCLAVYKSRVLTGLKALKLTTLTSNPPTFKGISSVDILSAHSAIVRWGVSAGVPAATFEIYMTPGTSVDWNADPVDKINATTLEWTTNALGDDLSYAFGVRACSSKDVCDLNTIQLTGSTVDDGIPKTVGATALAIVESKLRVTAPWINAQGGINKRLVYMTTNTGDPSTSTTVMTLVATVAVPDPSHPATELFVQPIEDNRTYTVIVYDQDSHGNKTAGNAPISLYSGDTHKPVFGGIATVTNGVGVANDHAEETTLRLNFVPIPFQPVDMNGTTDYLAYVAPGIVNACSLLTPYQIFAANSFTVADANAFIKVENLQPLTTYSVCLKARDAAGNISDNVVSFTKSTLDITPPVFDGVQTMSYDSDRGELQLTWNPSVSTDLYEFKIRLWKGLAADPDQAVSLTTTVRSNIAATGTRIKQSTFTMLSGELIHALVEACDNAGSVAGGSQNCSTHHFSTAKSVQLNDIDPPPGFLGIRSSSELESTVEGVITVKWVGPSDWSDYKGFKVYYVNAETNEIQSLAKDCPCTANSCPTPLTQCDLVGLDPFRTYRLHVRAYDDAGNMTLLDPVSYSVNKRAADTHAPNFTSNLQLAFSEGKAALAWGAASDNQYVLEPGADITYEVYRKVDEAFSTFNSADPLDPAYPNNDVHAGLVARVSSVAGTSWTDSGQGFEGGQTFFYTVCAVDGTGNRFCDGQVKSFLCPDLVPPVITSFTSTKTETGYVWDLNWVAHDVVTGDSDLQYKIYQKISNLEVDEASFADNLVYIASGVPTYTNLKGPLNTNTYIHYMLVVADAEGNKAIKHLSLYSENKVTLTSVRSNEGPLGGNKVLVLVGEGFKQDVGVKIGNSTCTSINRYSKKYILCKSPTSVDVGPVAVTVTNPDGSTSQLSNAYKYCSGASCTNVCNKSSAGWGTFASGTGVAADPYIMCTVDHLNAIKAQPYGKFYKLGENIDLAGDTTFVPLYSSAGSGVEFQGTFDGDKYVVSNWTYNNGVATTPVGFFSRLLRSDIKNLGLVNFTITGKDNVGALAGTAAIGQDGNYYPNSIIGVTAIGSVTAQSYVGGLIGRAGGTLSESAFIGNVTGNVNVGGIAGHKRDGSSKLEFTGNVLAYASGTSECGAGGIFGLASGNGYTHVALKTSGSVSCTDVSNTKAPNTGGIIGRADQSRIEDSENRATVTGGDRTTGIIGSSNGTTTFVNTRNYGDVTGWNDVAGFIGYTSFGNNVFQDSANYGNIKSNSGSYRVSGIASALEANGCCAHKMINVSNYGNISGGNESGGLIGNSSYITITDSANYGNISGVQGLVGGIAGSCSYCTMTNVKSTGDITGVNNNVGGIAGALTGSISGGSSSGKISGSNATGGAVGIFNSNSAVSALITGFTSNAIIQGSVGGQGNGGIVGILSSGYSSTSPGVIEKSSFTGSIKANSQCGGIVGQTNQYNIVRRVFMNGGSIECSTAAGGVIGLVNGNNVLVEQSFSKGKVKGLTYAGGFVGHVQRLPANSVAFNDNYSRTEVIGNDAVGGFAGTAGPVFNRCYASGKLSSIDTQSRFGGFLGDMWSAGAASSSFWDKTSSGFTTSPMGTGSTTSLMLGSSLYAPQSYQTTVWSFTPLDFPKLLWEATP
ncbi:MAG: hypothetical protein EOP04_00010 [Proteobacteria bacterium]|nr:MAG: hypothetical protein EOP04_00010 [Pseudomonadota bacterium]